MFLDCRRLTILDLSYLDTSNVTSMNSMFRDCSNLTSLDISNFNTSNVTDMAYMFDDCTSLTSLDMSNCDISKCSEFSAFSSMFGSNSTNSCIALTDFKAPKNISASINFQYCTALSHDSLMSIINNLITVTSTKTLTLGATNLAKLTDEEKAIATNKGWTLA
jgi:surface protein